MSARDDLTAAIDGVLGDVKPVFWINLAVGDLYVTGTNSDGTMAQAEIISITPGTQSLTVVVEDVATSNQSQITPSKYSLANVAI